MEDGRRPQDRRHPFRACLLRCWTLKLMPNLKSHRQKSEGHLRLLQNQRTFSLASLPPEIVTAFAVPLAASPHFEPIVIPFPSLHRTFYASTFLNNFHFPSSFIY